MKRLFLFFALAVSSVLLSCNTDPRPTERHDVVYILNSGNFSEHNGSIYVYEENTGSIKGDIVKEMNDSELGATIMDGIYDPYGVGYILCSNPDKVEILDLYQNPGRKLTKPITDDNDQLRNVREITLGGNWIFVSNQGTEYKELPDGMREYTKSFVSVFRISDMSYVKKIEVGSDAQDLIYVNNKLYVATKEGIVVIRCEVTEDFILSDTIKPDADFAGPVKYLAIRNISENTLYASIPGKGIWAVSLADDKSLKSYPMEMDYDGYLFSAADGYIYTYVNRYGASGEGSADVLRFDPKAGDVTKAVPTGTNFYSVGVSPSSGNIFYSESNGFATNSTMNVVEPRTGQIIDTETAGVNTYRYLFLSYYTYVDEK